MTEAVAASTIVARLGLHLPALPCPLAVRFVEDAIVDGFGLVRTSASPAAEIAVVHDGSERGVAEALAYSDLIKLAPTMLTLLVEALGAWDAQFDGVSGNDDDGYVSGSDLMEWFSGWRLQVRTDLAVAAASR